MITDPNRELRTPEIEFRPIWTMTPPIERKRIESFTDNLVGHIAGEFLDKIKRREVTPVRGLGIDSNLSRLTRI